MASMTASSSADPAKQPKHPPTQKQIRRWRRYLAEERAEAAVYLDLAAGRTGEEREILLALAEAEKRHQAHWEALLGDQVGQPQRGALRTRITGFLARHFGSVFVLALVQRSETRSPYEREVYASDQMAADEQVHGEVVRGLATRGREQLSGTFRAAVFGANDGIVSNLALVLGAGAAGLSSTAVLTTGLVGLLAGALSMAAGEYISVKSQRELLEASTPQVATSEMLAHLDLDENELSLVYRARGMSEQEAELRANQALTQLEEHPATQHHQDHYQAIGTGMKAALSSFIFFASGAIVPVIPYLFGMGGLAAVLLALVLVGFAMVGTGASVALLSGRSPWRGIGRQFLIGYGAAGLTYLLGLIFGEVIG